MRLDRRIVCARALQEQRPLRTFRTEFNIYESSTCEERYTSTTTHYTQSQYSLERRERTERTERTETVVSSDATRRSSSQESTRPDGRSTSVDRDGGTITTTQSDQDIEKVSRKRQQEEDEKKDRMDEASWSRTSSSISGSSVHFSESRSVKRIERVEEGIGTENVIEARGIVDPRTGNVLTVGEAISLRILDVRNGRITCSRDGRKTVSIEEAAREKIIEARLADRLLGPCGFDEEGRPVSLLEAIQRELFDAEKPDGSGHADRAKVTYSKESVPVDEGAVSVADAIKDDDVGKGSALDPRTGELVTKDGERLSVEEAHARGYLAKLDVTVTVKRNALPLSDAISQGLVDETLGRVLDRITGESYALDEAVEKGILDPNAREVVDARNDTKVTLLDAMKLGIVNPKTGKYMHGLTMEKLSLKEARRRRLIVKPMTLKDCRDSEIIDESGKITSPAHRTKLTVTEAIERGVLDADRLKSIVDATTGETITLSEALDRGLINPKTTTYRNANTDEEIAISEAVEKGLVTSLAQKTIFDVDGFRDPLTGEYVSLNAALLKGLISSKSGGSYIVDPNTGERVSLAEAEERGYIRPEVAEMFNRGIGIVEEGKEITLLEAVFSELIDPKTGLLLDPRTKKPVALENAMKRGIITPDGAALLTGLLNVTVTTQTTTKVKEVKHEEINNGFERSTKERVHVEAMDVEETLEPSLKDNIPRAIGTTTTIISKDHVVTSSEAKASILVNAKDSSKAKDNDNAVQTSRSNRYKDPDQDQDTSMISDPSREDSLSMEKRVFELPTDGWSLSEAIDRKLFDPTTGLFIIPGTDRLVSFEECVKLRIIDPNSSFVIDPNNGRKVSLLRSLEKNILDSTGHYTYPQKISMKEAIDRGLVLLEGKTPDIDHSQQRLLRITKMSGEPDKLEVMRLDDPSKQLDSKDSESYGIPDPVRVSRGLIYDPITALVISTETKTSKELLAALSDGTLPMDVVIVTDPVTGKAIQGIPEAIQRGIIDPKTLEYYVNENRKLSLMDAAKFGAVTVLGIPLVPVTSSTPISDTNIPREMKESSPIDRDQSSIIGKPNYESDSAIGSTSVMDSVTDFSPTAATSEEPSISKEGDEERFKPFDPKYEAIIGETVVWPSSEGETKSIVLQKMRKRVVKAKEALESGLIDAETAEIFTRKMAVEDGKPVTLSEAIRSKKIDADSGKIVDPQRGDILNIGEAVERGVLDPVSADVLVPLAKSLSIPGLYKQGLLDPHEGKVVHPETGAHLTLKEAILCEIVDPLSKLTCSDGRTETLRSAIESDLVDPERSLIKTSQGDSVSLVKAVESNVFADSDRDQERIPPAGMTFTVALERGLIDAAGKEIRHPITEERLSLEDAIKGNFIMSLPCPVTSDSMEVTKALEAGLIDREKGVFVHPTTGTPVRLLTAIESGLLVVKPPISSESVTVTTTGITETVTCHHTVTTKSIDILSGYALVGPNEVRNMETGDTMTIDEARTKGIVREESEKKVEFTTKDIKMTFDDALQKGLLDMNAGTYTNPSTGCAMSIQKAIENGLLEDRADPTAEKQPIDQIYDEKTERFLDPETKKSYTLKEAVEVGLVDPNTVLYDPRTAETVTTKQALEKGMIDPVTGKTKDVEGGGVSLKQAAKLGLLAVVAAPVLAGKAVYDAVRDASAGKEKVVTKEVTKVARSADTAKVTKVDIVKDTLPKADIVKDTRPKEGIVKDTPKEDAVKVTPKEDIATHPKEDGVKVTGPEEDIAKVTPPKEDAVRVTSPEEGVVKVTHPKEDGVKVTSPEEDVKVTHPKEDVVKVTHPEEDAAKTTHPEEDIVKVTHTKEEIVEVKHSKEDIVEVTQPKEDIAKVTHPEEDGVKVTGLEEDIVKVTRPEEEVVKATAKEEEKVTAVAAPQIPSKDDLTKEVVQKVADKVPTPKDSSEQAQKEALKSEIQSELPKKETQEKKPETLKTEPEQRSKADIPVVKVEEPSEASQIQKPIETSLEEPDEEQEKEIDFESEEGDRRFVIEVTPDLTVQDLVVRDAYDPEKERFLNPETGEVISFNDFVLELRIFDPDEVLVKDLTCKTRDRYVSLRDAIAKPLVDRNLGNMVDPKTGKKIPFFEAVKLGLIKQGPPMEHSEATESKEGLSLRQAVEIGLLDPATCEVRDPTTNKMLKLNEAIEIGLIDPDSISIRDPVNDEVSPLPEVLESGAKVDVEDAFVKGLIVPESRKPISLEAAIRKGLYEEDTGKITDTLTSQSIDVEESVRRGIIDAFISECEDTKAGTFLSLEEALGGESKLLDPNTGRLRDTKAGELLPLNVALDRGMILTTGFVPSLIDVIVQEYYSPRTGLVANPRTGEETTLKEALATDYVDGETTMVRDDRNDRVLSLQEAEENQLIDLEQGILLSPHPMTLDVAYEKGYILSTVKPWSLQEALAHQTYDPEKGTFDIDGVTYTLEEALENGLIAKDSPSVKDPRNSEIISLGEAIKQGLIDPKTATAIDPSTSSPLSLTDALDRGLIVPAKRKISLPEAVFKGLYEPTTGRFIVPETREKLPTDRAIKVGVIDPSTAVVVRQPHGKAITFTKAIKELIVDPKTGTVTNEKGKPVDFREALEHGLLLEARRPMTFSEAISKGILDKRTNMFLDPQTGVYLTLIEAIRKNLIDADSVTVKDGRSGFRHRISMMEAIRTGYIDGSKGKVNVTPESTMSLQEAYEAGLIVDHRAAVSLQRAIHQGLYDEQTGKITDPTTGRAVTLHEAMRNCLINPTLPCYWDKRADRLLSLAETCRATVIDRRSGMFKEPGANRTVSLTLALQLGLIVDIETAEFNLHQAIMMNIYDPATGKLTHPSTNQVLTLAEACRSELIDPHGSIIRDVRSDKYLPLSDAVSSGVIDDIRGTYNALPEREEPINLREAANKGYIVPSQFPLSIEEAVNCYLYRGQTGVFVDPRTNESHDLARAFDVGLLDPDTTALKDVTTGQITSLSAGIENGLIDVPQGRVIDSKTKRGYPIDVALERGLLVTLEKPMTQQSARRSLIRKEEPRQEYTLQEAVDSSLLDENAAVIRDPKSGRFVTVSNVLADGMLDPSVKATFEGDAPKTADGKLVPRFVRFGDVEVFFIKPLSFEEATEKGHLSMESGKLTDPKTGEPVTLKEAVDLGIVDSDSALIKDTKKRKLVKLSEAFRKGLMDAEKGNVLETETSRLYPLSKALETELLITPKRGLSFIEALMFGLYDATSGRFNDPFLVASASDRKPTTLKEAIDSGLIDPSSTVIKEPATGKIVSLLEAINTEIIDPIAGRLIEDPSGKNVDFAKALEQGYILTAEARQAVEEKYKLCDETSSRLLQWISEVEDKLANQGNVKEDIDDLRNQINAMKEIKEDLEAHSRPVASCLDQIRQVVLTGSNVLSSEEVSTLEKNGRSLKTRFDRATDRTERMVKRLTAARDDLVKFKNELSTFSHWLDNARRVLEEKEHSLTDLNRLNSSTDATRDFISDVIAHQADLRFITMAAQKFVDESKEFLHVLNEFRTSLPQRLPHKEPVASQDSPVRGEVSIVTAQYKDLLSRANMLSDRLSGVGGRQRDYRESLEKARNWLKEVEPKVHRAISEPVAAEPKQVEDQLSKAKALNNEMLANERLVENVKVTVEALLRSLDGQLTPKEVDELEEPAKALEDKYKQLTNAIGEKCQELDAALVRSQGVQDALDSLVLWLNNIESQFKNIQRPASLQKERLEEQQRDQRLLQADLDSHRLSVEAVASSAHDLLTNSSNARIAKRIESKLKDVQCRFEKLMDKSLRRGEFLDEIAQALGDFLVETTKFDSWYAHMIEALESRDLSKLDVAEYETKMANLMDKREDQRASFEDLIRNGKNLISKKDVTDVAQIRDKITALESQWKEVNNLIEEKQRLSKSRAKQLSAYEKLRDQVIDWLTRTEHKVQGLEPVAVDLEKLKRQADELKPIQKEYRDYGNTVDKVNDLGIAYDGLLKERIESPTRRRGSTSPTKRPVRRMSQDGRSPSPAKLYAAQSPVSPGGSSGFSSRRSSQDGFHLEDLSPVQQQLSEINNRYGLLGVRLTDRQTELDSVKDELRRHMDNLKTLSQFLEKIQRQIPKETMPGTKEEADKTAKQIKIVIEEMYEKQSLLDTTRTQVRDLVRRKKGAAGVDRLNDEMEDVTNRWRSFSERCKDRIKFLDDVKDFYDTSEGLASWLGSKERMLGALGPISADPRMVASQVQQVQVLREEFRTQQPQLDHLIQVGENILSVIGTDSPDGQRTSTKLRSILDKWSDQLARLDERAQSLGDAVDTSREFDASLNRLRDALQAISDNLDELTLEKDPEDQLRKIENLERQLEGQRPLLADAEAAGEQLCEVLSDPASKSEIHGKLAAVGKLYTNLQKKLDHKKAEIEGNLRDGRQFEASCTKTLGWLADELGNMSEKLLVSADRDILQQQLDHHEPMYRNVMGKEHEVIMLLNKGRDMLARSQKVENRSLQRDLDKMQSQWDRLKKDMMDRHTKLQTCAEHCKKYYKAQDAFLPWLRQAEDKLECLKPASFKRKDIEKQLKELSSFRNEVWKHSGEFENNKTLGETFLGACDIDKQNVKNELGAMKTRWDKLNNDLIARTQSLEDTARHLMDFNENLRELRHSLQRCEDKLASHDALGGAAKDPKLLDRIKSLREETTNLKKPLQYVKQQASDLVNKAREQGVDATHLQDEVNNLSDRINDLQAKLDDRCNELQSAATAVAQFNDQAKTIGQQVSSLERELDSMRAPGREIKIIRVQIEETTKVITKVTRLYEEVTDLEGLGERLVDYGFAADAVATREQVAGLKRQVVKLDDRSRDRHEELSATLDRLQEFYQAHTTVISEIDEANEHVRRFKPVGSEVESIKVQQEDFRLLKINKIEPLARAVEDCNVLGQALIQTAGRDVNTSNIEKDVDKMNERWNDLKERLNERDRRLDVGLLQSGKFQEALEGLQKWLTDTEEMVSNQKPPSSDYKVVKAQLQEQKFLKKMLMDRQNSMSSLYNMGQEVAAGADPKERKMIEKQLKELVGRFDNLTESAAERMEALEQAMGVAKQFQDKLVPLAIWLDKTEKRVRDMELVPTDEEKIQQRVTEHDALHEDILSRKPDFSELTEIASQLMALVGEDEAAALADKLQDAADRYAALVERSEALGSLLQRSRQGLRHLVLSYQELQAWMEGMEIRLSKYRVLAVHTEKLLQQMEDLADLTEEVSTRQTEVDSTTDAGLELMKHISSDEALQLKDKLDSLQRRFNDLVSRGSDLLKHAQESLPLVQQFHDNHNRLMDWMQAAESALQSAEPREDEIVRLEMEISEYRPVLDKINAVGPQLSQLSPGEGAATIEGLVTRDNRRFDAIAEQIQRKAERIQLSKQRSLEVIGDIDDLLEWFREVDNQLREAEPPSSEPEIIRVQLKEHKALNDDISSQKGRVRDVISTAKKVIRENGQHEDTSTIREKMEDLRETMEIVSGLSADRLGALEQALPLAEHLRDTHIGLVSWLEEAEQQVAMLPMPALRPDLIAAQQDKNELLMQSINEHKPLVEKLTKTGEALLKLVNEEEGIKIQDILEADTARYAALRAELRSRQQTLEQALQESSQFSDKLEGMLRALSSTADQVNGAEPISAHPGRLRDQMEENTALVDELAQRSEAYAAVKRAADDVISKAGNRADPAVKDIKRKLDKLNKLWSDVQRATNERGHTLDDALAIAEKFWSELNGVMSTLRELQDALAGQAPPAAQPAAIQQQQVALQEIRHEIDQTKPDVEQVRASGHELMGLCGEPDKPEVRKHIEDLDQAWDNVTALYARREENLIDAMEKAMEFHETLQNLLEFLQEAEDKFARMGPLGSDIDEVKKQIKQLANFKAEVDPHMVKVEALNRSLTRQAAELTERTSSEQAAAIKEPLGAVNKRWDGLLRGLVERQRLLENALLRLGQFQHALDELLVWIEKTDDTLDNLKAVAGDPQVIEVELAKLKVLVNDIQAHQTSVDTLNDAGRQLIEDGKGTAEASTTAEKLGTLNRRWRDLLQRAADRQRELEDALREAQSFTAEIQDLLSWLGDVDNTIVASKPVGGLPETASEQLERFMEVYNELEQNRPKVETVLQQGQEYLKRADTSSAGGLNHNLKTLKQRWDNVTARASDKKIKLEIALKEATEFHDALQAFVDWLTNAEKILTNLKPVSRVMETILGQIEEHKAFQKDVGVHRETMLNLDKKGTHLKYFSQKQDVILIKNLLISVQHRWERVVSKSAERTRALDHGYKEAREFHDAWSNLMNWLDETEKTLDEVATDGGLGGNDPEKIKARLNKHRELQKALSAKQGTYDVTMKNGKLLKDKAPKSDESALKELLNELKNKWTTVCGKCVDRQRKLEEALLFSGQFKDAIQALLEWLSKSQKQLTETGPLHGDLDTVMNLVEQHKTFEKDLKSRESQMKSVIQTGWEILRKAPEDASAIESQISEMHDLWNTVTKLSLAKTSRLEEALREAERLHKAVHVLLEWLSDAEMKLRFAGQLPEDEQESRNQLMEHERFLRELRIKEVEKDQTLELAHTILGKAHPDGAAVIKHWITIIQSRWEEVATWAHQRNQRLENHMQGLQDLDNLLEELLSWLEGLENTLNALEAEPLPDDKATLEMLIADHREFMENTSRRQNEVDRVCKARQVKPVKDTKKILKAKSPAPTRGSPGRDRTADSLPHIGPRFPPKGSKGAEPEFRSPRVKLLWDRWRHVWMLAWERQRRLQDKYNYIQELDRVANFSWEDWRKRFLKFMNHKKSRLTDLFRKMDKNNDGLIPREDFIQGIMNTKFETSRLEMGAVADLFDRHGEGLIDWKEFIAALRPDWEERRTYNDTDKIHDEVKRLVMLCTCRQKFRVFQVGEGKYRFGDSQKLRLVRILRSTVMVRVGGGWVALDEFLLKNDPCRVFLMPIPDPNKPEQHEGWCPLAKGRTNIELREQFILADGVSQTMTAFRSKPSPTSTLQRTNISSANAGPITKVRERSARSVPMGQSRASRSSLSAGTPDSLSDNESSFKIGSARKTSTPYRSTITPGGSRPSSRPASRPASRPTSRPGSRPASRQGSKPPSRYGSTQSLDSTDDSSNLSRIPRRTTVSTTGNTPTSSRHNSVSGKRLGTPVNGSSSRPRTPTGLVSPASGVPARFGTIHRASSIPTLTGVGTPISRSRIPVYVGTDIKSPQSTTSNISTHSTQSNHSTVSTDSTGSSSMCTNSATNTSSAVKQARTRTPSSGSSTPLPPSLKLSRKPSGASDTSVSTTPASQRRGKPTPIDQRAPFRL
ncbi:dystonin-like protein short stop isoform X32 [Megachile rotundata]|uniref:dystonin-like protein short stop isoform X32 n=1 Tax=Megachile rotundata TaxID=143995 RepID=UPI003FD4A258